MRYRLTNLLDPIAELLEEPGGGVGPPHILRPPMEVESNGCELNPIPDVESTGCELPSIPLPEMKCATATDTGAMIQYSSDVAVYGSEPGVGQDSRGQRREAHL